MAEVPCPCGWKFYRLVSLTTNYEVRCQRCDRVALRVVLGGPMENPNGPVANFGLELFQ